MPDLSKTYSQKRSTAMQAKSFGVGIPGTGILGRRMMGALQQHPRFCVVAAWDPARTAQTLDGLATADEAAAVVRGIEAMLAS